METSVLWICGRRRCFSLFWLFWCAACLAISSDKEMESSSRSPSYKIKLITNLILFRNDVGSEITGSF